MIYLTGVTNDAIEPYLVEAGIGLMLNPAAGYARRCHRYPFTAVDNGCFGDKHDEDKWIRQLEIVPRENCLFAVAPDVYPDAQASLDRGREWFPILREMGYPVAVVAQDGAERLSFPWNEFDCLFVGGEQKPSPRDEWKLSGAAEQLVHRARAHGKWVHMGRVNGMKRMERARDMGCLSADGTFLKYRLRRRELDVDGERGERGPVEIKAWVDWLRANPPLFSHETPSLPIHRRHA